MVKVKAWEELTGRAYTQKSNIDCSDDVVYSAPGVSTGPISVVDLKFRVLM
jgi:SecD/SecF fusion protein